MSCEFCVSVDTGEGYTGYQCVVQVTLENHSCCECGKPIEVGENYEFASGDWDGEECTHHTCLICSEIANGMSCYGDRCHGTLWEDLEMALDQAEEPITTRCFDQLQTAAAKRVFQEFWINFMRLGKAKQL